jgi:hypothetical protein
MTPTPMLYCTCINYLDFLILRWFSKNYRDATKKCVAH